MPEIKLRKAVESDSGALLRIYRPYVEHSSATLEDDVPSHEEFLARVRTISTDFPYLVCEANGKIVGYAYAHSYKERSGYRFCAELSVYVAEDSRGMGIGGRLYKALIDILRAMGYKNLYGIVTDPNEGSFALHKSLGFRETGREHLSGVKFGKWHDVVLFEKHIASHYTSSGIDGTRPLKINELPVEIFSGILAKYCE